MSLEIVIYVTIVIFVTYQIVLLLRKYIETLRLARRIPGFKDTRFIEGDLWVGRIELLKQFLTF